MGLIIHNSKAIILLFMMFSFLLCYGQDSHINARIDISSSDIVLHPKSCSKNAILQHISWGDKQRRKFSLYSEFYNLPEGEWSKCVISFLPSKDGKINISLKSGYSKQNGNKKADATWVFYDLVEVTGAKILNGDFSKKDKNNKPANWDINNSGNYITGGSGLLSYKYVVRAWHDRPVSQSVQVKKNQEVTITAYVMPDKIEFSLD